MALIVFSNAVSYGKVRKNDHKKDEDETHFPSQVGLIILCRDNIWKEKLKAFEFINRVDALDLYASRCPRSSGSFMQFLLDGFIF